MVYLVSSSIWSWLSHPTLAAASFPRPSRVHRIPVKSNYFKILLMPHIICGIWVRSILTSISHSNSSSKSAGALSKTSSFSLFSSSTEEFRLRAFFVFFGSITASRTAFATRFFLCELLRAFAAFPAFLGISNKRSKIEVCLCKLDDSIILNKKFGKHKFS